MSDERRQPSELVALCVMLAYGLMAAVSLVLATPGTFASPLFPAAGLALGATLRYGVAASLGVAVGSFAVNALWARHLGHAGMQAWALPAAFAIGAALQSQVSAALVQRLLGKSPRLDQPVAVLNFMLGGALLGCLTSASVAVGAALALGATADPAGMWWTWWSGDALGTLVATPVVLALIGRPTSVWRPRRWSVALPLALGAGLFGWASHELHHWTGQRAQLAFERDARSAVGTVVLTLERQLDALMAMHSLFEGGEDVSRTRFRGAAMGWLQRLPSLYAVGYSERIGRSDAERIEAIRRQDERPEFQVFEREAELAAQDADWVAIRYIEPEARNAAAVGVNALSIGAARRAINDAFGQRTAVATAGFALTQAGGQPGVVVYQPVALPGQGGWRGVVFATLRMDEALRGLGGQLPAGMTLCIVDRSAGMRARLAGPAGCEADDPSRWTHARGTRFATRDWEVRAAAPKAVYAAGAQHAGEAGIFALSGMSATALLGLFLLTLSGRAQRSEEAARRRAAELGRERVSRDHEHHARVQSERRFEALFNDVPVGVAFTDLSGTVLEANAAMAALIGVDQAAVRGLAVKEFISAEDWPDHLRQRQDLAAGRMAVMRRRVRMLRQGGEPFPAMVTARLVQGDEPSAARIVSLVEDWSEREQLDTARRARMQAEAASMAKSGFLSRMSHELRTPLNAILGFTQLLSMNKSDALPAQHQHWLTQIQSAGWHLLQMIEEVLDLSKIEAGELKLDLRPVPLLPLLEECLSMVTTDAKQRQVQLGPVQGGIDAQLAVHADPTRLRQVMLNLLSNAVKYNRAGGQVNVHCSLLDDGRVQVDVQDTGIGMAEDQLQRLFRPFDRLGREKTGQQGAGIGLVIARHLVEHMNGRLEVSSRPGEGSTFSVTLAAHQQGQGPQGAPAGAGLPDAAYHRRRVLLVEDNELNIELMRGIMQQRPQVHLQVFQTGLPAAAAARVHPPDAVILDINLPDIDGIELLRQLKADPVTANVPVMVISASVLAEEIQRASDAGAAAFLGKPVVAARFLALLDGFLSQATTDFGALDT